MSFSPKEFWNQKILGWEKSRYKSSDNLYKTIFSNSVEARMYLAEKVLGPIINKKSVLELGCGSGVLAIRLASLDMKSYKGLDISSVAIEKAKEKENKTIKFEVNDLSENIKDDSDIIISLGLTDWLNPTELKNLEQLSRGKLFLHSFSHKRFDLIQLFHKVYVFFSYGYKSKGYVPRYYKTQELRELFDDKNLRFLFHKNMKFGGFVTNIKDTTLDKYFTAVEF